MGHLFQSFRGIQTRATFSILSGLSNWSVFLVRYHNQVRCRRVVPRRQFEGGCGTSKVKWCACVNPCFSQNMHMSVDFVLAPCSPPPVMSETSWSCPSETTFDVGADWHALLVSPLPHSHSHSPLLLLLLN